MNFWDTLEIFLLLYSPCLSRAGLSVPSVVEGEELHGGFQYSLCPEVHLVGSNSTEDSNPDSGENFVSLIGIYDIRVASQILSSIISINKNHKN